jgi:SNF2 family DNA or RNA helicase
MDADRSPLFKNVTLRTPRKVKCDPEQVAALPLNDRADDHADALRDINSTSDGRKEVVDLTVSPECAKSVSPIDPPVAVVPVRSVDENRRPPGKAIAVPKTQPRAALTTVCIDDTHMEPRSRLTPVCRPSAKPSATTVCVDDVDFRNPVTKVASSSKLPTTSVQPVVSIDDLHLAMGSLSIKERATKQEQSVKNAGSIDVSDAPPVDMILHNDFTFFPHQRYAVHKCLEALRREGVSGVFRGGGVLLAAEPGLGKTLMALVVALLSRRDISASAPSYVSKCIVVVCPKSVLREWGHAIEQFFGSSVKYLIVHKEYGFDPAKLTNSVLDRHDVIITPYSMVVSAATKTGIAHGSLFEGQRVTDFAHASVRVCETYARSSTGQALLFYRHWHSVILDESQTIANSKTRAFSACMNFIGRYYICLSGTPVRNWEADLLTQFKFLGLQMPLRETSLKTVEEYNLRRWIVSMTYEEANIKLPEPIILKGHVYLGERASQMYGAGLKSAQRALRAFEQQQSTFAAVFSEIMRLRQLCIAPFLTSQGSKAKMLECIREQKIVARLDSVFARAIIAEKRVAEDKKRKLESLPSFDALLEEDETESHDIPCNCELEAEDDPEAKAMATWHHDLKGTAGIKSDKMQELVARVSVVPDHEKVIIFSTFSKGLLLSMLAIREAVGKRKIFAFIDGTVTGEDRDDELAFFRDNRNTSSPNVLLMTYKVGGEGLNITQANHVIFLEPWWSPAVHIQAFARIQRIGQKYSVTKHDLIVQDSVEQRVLELCDEKLRVASRAMGEKAVKSKATGLSKEDLRRILGTA